MAGAQTIDALPKLYEQKGFCAGVKDKPARLQCFEKLAAEAIALSEALNQRLAAATQKLPPPQPPAPTKSPEQLEADRIAEIVAKHDLVLRAFTALRASRDAGLSYVQYGPMIQAAATEVALVRERAKTEQEREAVAKYEAAIDAYRDAATWWERDISFYARRDNGLAYAGGLPFKQVGLEALVRKWNLPTTKSDIWGLHAGVPRSVALSTIWMAADAAIAAARDALQRRADQAPPPPTFPAGPSRDS